MFCWAMYAFTLWLKEPNVKTAAVLGVSSGLSLGAKFSTLVFLQVCGAAILVLYWFAGQRNWRRVAAKVLGKSSGLTNVIHKITSTVPAPMPEIPDGPRDLREPNRMGTPSYIFGQVRNRGFWYFFIASLVLKTPFGSLVAGGVWNRHRGCALSS